MAVGERAPVEDVHVTLYVRRSGHHEAVELVDVNGHLWPVLEAQVHYTAHDPTIVVLRIRAASVSVVVDDV